MSADMRGGADVETGALVLVGGAEAFAWFSRCLRDVGATTVQLKPVTGWSAIRPIAFLRVKAGPHVATIQIEDDAATLSGDQESLIRLADEVDLFLEHNDLTEPGMHAHLDLASWSAAQALLRRSSRALILAGPVPDSS